MAVFCLFCLTFLRSRSSNVKNPKDNSVNNSLFFFDPPQNLALLRSSLKFNALVSHNEKLKPTMSRPAATQASKLFDKKFWIKGPEYRFVLNLPVCWLILHESKSCMWSQVIST